MIVAATIAEVRSTVKDARDRGAQIGFVPTMGFLHSGHLSLIDAARRNGASFIVVSLFVNPTQFGPREDFKSYPRDQKRDEGMLRECGVDILFTPAVDAMYPPGAATTVHVGGVAEPLEGERRPGHFDGVATVVTKLFNIVRPDFAMFGQKDAQQCAVIRRMVRDLDLPVKIYTGETIREADGLAMSSRNSYLSAEERQFAPALYRALEAGRIGLIRGDEAEAVTRRMHDSLAAASGVQLDYLELVDPETFRAPADLDRDLVLVGAVRVGKIRLIDNIPVRREDLLQ